MSVPPRLPARRGRIRPLLGRPRAPSGDGASGGGTPDGGTSNGRSALLRSGVIRRPGAAVSVAWSGSAGPTPLHQGEGSGFAFFLLLAALPMFGQVFHYMIDVGPLYYLSKAWPLLMLPFSAYGLATTRGWTRGLIVVALAYALGVAPLMSMIWLGNDFVDALGTTVKVWPLSYFFALSGLLALLRPPPAMLRRVLVALGCLTLAVLWTLWLVVPHSAYSGDPGQSRLLMFDNERGDRIILPLTFALLLMFQVAARMMQRPRLWHGLFLIFGFASLVLINKQRVTVVMTAATLGWIVLTRLPRPVRSLALAAGGLAAVAALGWGVLSMDRMVEELGASLTIRLNSLGLVGHFLAEQPLRWVFGAGATTRFGAITLGDIMGRHDFFLADVGWAGVVFEYGVVGALLTLSLYLPALPRRGDDPPDSGWDGATIAALAAYGLFLLLSTLAYSAVFTPGELASVMALLAYLRAERAGTAGTPAS